MKSMMSKSEIRGTVSQSQNPNAVPELDARIGFTAISLVAKNDEANACPSRPSRVRTPLHVKVISSRSTHNFHNFTLFRGERPFWLKAKISYGLIATLALVLVTGSGCATQSLLIETKPHDKWNSKTEKMEEVPGNNGAYAGIPFSVAWDMATAPFAGLIFVLWYASGYRC
jgi:hypothetical protein